jgi:hypothetical protein
MANALYDTFKEGLLNKEFDLDTDGIMASLIDTGYYTYSAAHNEYSGGSQDVSTSAKIADTTCALTTPTISNGTFDSDNFTWSSVAAVTSGGDAQAEAIILWDDDIANDRLIAYYDTGMSGMKSARDPEWRGLTRSVPLVA